MSMYAYFAIYLCILTIDYGVLKVSLIWLEWDANKIKSIYILTGGLRCAIQNLRIKKS